MIPEYIKTFRERFIRQINGDYPDSVIITGGGKQLESFLTEVFEEGVEARKMSVISNEKKMNVSEWRDLGEKFGYADYFREEARREGYKEGRNKLFSQIKVIIEGKKLEYKQECPYDFGCPLNDPNGVEGYNLALSEVIETIIRLLKLV